MRGDRDCTVTVEWPTTIMTCLETEDPSEGELLRQSANTKALWRCREQLKLQDGVLHYWVARWDRRWQD